MVHKGQSGNSVTICFSTVCHNISVLECLLRNPADCYWYFARWFHCGPSYELQNNILNQISFETVSMY